MIHHNDFTLTATGMVLTDIPVVAFKGVLNESVMMIATALCSLLGSLFTKKVLHKHLEKAGIV